MPNEDETGRKHNLQQVLPTETKSILQILNAINNYQISNMKGYAAVIVVSNVSERNIILRMAFEAKNKKKAMED